MADDNRSDGGDETLERAVRALRDAPVPDGPPPHVIERTLAALRGANDARLVHIGRRLGPTRLALRAAAALALATLVAGVYFTRPAADQTANTAPTARPSPDRVATSEPQVVHAPPPPGPLPKPAEPRPAGTTPDAPAKGDAIAGVPKPVDPPKVEAAAAAPTIAGTIFFDGVAPEPARIDMSAVRECRERHPDGGVDESLVVNGGRLANVVVSIEPTDGRVLAGALPAEPVVLDQRDCRFRPHVLAAMVGQDLIIRNSDPFLHNVHSRATLNEDFNIGQPSLDPGKRVEPLRVPERFEIRCDLHPWMSARVSVFEHPYFGVSKDDGSFAIPAKGLPDGRYQLTAWHETLGERLGEVVIKDGQAARVDLRFALAAARAGDARTMQACAGCEPAGGSASATPRLAHVNP